MTVEELIVVNPRNKEHLELIENYEKENEINTRTSSYLKRMNQMSEEEYNYYKKNTNEIEESLLLKKENEIKDICHIEGEKDRKVCSISFSPIRTKLRNRRLITLAIDYAFHILKMESIFVKISKKDKNMIENLEIRGFENLGIENNDIIYLKENEEIKDNKGTYHENSR